MMKKETLIGSELIRELDPEIEAKLKYRAWTQYDSDGQIESHQCPSCDDKLRFHRFADDGNFYHRQMKCKNNHHWKVVYEFG